MPRIIRLLLIALCTFPATTKALTAYVSPTGGDYMATTFGTQANPYKTVGFAIGRACNGPIAYDTVLVAPGLYDERYDILITKSLVIMASAPDVILDGTYYIPPAIPLDFMTTVAADVSILGLTFQNFMGKPRACIRIFAPNNVKNITISGCTFRQVGCGYDFSASLCADGTAIIQADYSDTIRHLRITNNLIDGAYVGQGNAISLRTRIDSALIENNVIRNVCGGGIYLAGIFNSILRRNSISRCINAEEVLWGAGVTLNYAQNLEVSYNEVFENAAGWNIYGGNTNKLHMHNNLTHHNSIVGMVVGATDAGLLMSNATIYHNTFYNNGIAQPINGLDSIHYQPMTGLGEIHLQGLDTVDFSYNIIWPTPGQHAMAARIPVPVKHFSAGHNLYYNDGVTNMFGLFCGTFNNTVVGGGVLYKTLPAFVAATGVDSTSRYGNAAFVNGNGYDLRLMNYSPAIDMGGLYDPALSGDSDMAHFHRLYGASPDAGAYELQSPFVSAIGATKATNNRIQLYPNPATDGYVYCPQTVVAAGFYNMQGAEVLRTQPKAGIIDMAGIAPGVYYVACTLSNGSYAYTQLIVR